MIAACFGQDQFLLDGTFVLRWQPNRPTPPPRTTHTDDIPAHRQRHAPGSAERVRQYDVTESRVALYQRSGLHGDPQDIPYQPKRVPLT